MKIHPLGRLEELVLRSVVHLRGNAYGVSIRRCVEGWTEQNVSIGAIYSTLERLEEKGYLRSKFGEPTPVRGGRAKRFYSIDKYGVATLEQLEQTRIKIEGST